MKQLSPIDLNQNELRNGVLQNLASAPSSPRAGQVYYDTTLLTARQWNGTAWVAFDATKTTGIPLANLATDPLNRANHTGTQASSTISDLPTVVKGYTLDQFAAPAVDLNLNGKKITNQADPVNPQDSATKNYVDTNIGAATAGIISKPSVRAVSNANIATLSGLPTVDGVTLVAGDRLLLPAQTTTSQNGVYVVAAGAWPRASGDASGNNELALGATWFVEQGTTFAASTWRLATPTTGAITPGTTAVTILQNSAAQSYTGSNGVQLTGNNFSGQVVAGGGLTAGASGFAVDTTVVARKFSQAIGDGSSVSITVTHNLGTVDVVVSIRDTSGNAVQTDWQAASTSTVIFTFAAAPALNAYRVTIIG